MGGVRGGRKSWDTAGAPVPAKLSSVHPYKCGSPVFPHTWASPQWANHLMSLQMYLYLTNTYSEEELGGLTFSRRSLDGQCATEAERVASPGPARHLRNPCQQKSMSQAVTMPVLAGPKQRSGTGRSWCRSPGKQAARRRSSKRSQVPRSFARHFLGI